MATFDPKKRPAQDNDGVPASDYLLVVRSFQRRLANTTGNPYLRARYEVIAGPMKGKSFFDSIGLDVTNSGTALRLGIFAELCGQHEAFDLDDDAALRTIFCNKPFKARVRRTIDGQYVNNGIERYFQLKDVSQREQEIMVNWAADTAGDDSWGYGGGSKGGDDDIPF